MAVPDHRALARSSLSDDEHLTSFPDSSHTANAAARTRGDAPTVSMTRLAGTHLVRRQRGVTLFATTRVAHRDGRTPMGPRSPR